jgi:hypothetical protein
VSDVVYSVEVRYLQSGNLAAGLKDSSSALDKIGSAFSGISSIAGSFNSVLDTVGSTILGLAASATTGLVTAAAGGFAMATVAAFHFNDELERTQLSLANIANATGLLSKTGLEGASTPLSNGMRLAGDVVKQMRIDARELPGEFKDLQNIMALMQPSMANAGVGMFGTEKMAAYTMTAASQLNIPMATAGREMGMMISGNARHNMPMFSKLGFTDSKAFNEMSQKDRISAIDAKIGEKGLSSPEALARVKGTWEVIRSTAIDTFRQSASLVGGPLFARVKELVNQFNHLGDNTKLKDTLIDMGVSFGNMLVTGLDRGIEAIQHWYGPVTTFLGTMERGFARIFGGMGPMLGQILGKLEAFFNDPAAFDKLEKIAISLISMRAGGGALEMAADAASMLPGAASAIGMLGGAGAAAELLLPLAAAAALAAAAVQGFTHALMDGTSFAHDAATSVANDTWSNVKKIGSEFGKLADTLQPVMDAFGVYAAALLDFVTGNWARLFTVTNLVVDGFEKMLALIPGYLPKNDDGKAEADKVMADTRYSPVIMSLKAMNAGQENSELGAKKPPTHTTHIHKVEIKVSSNQDPSRIARKTAEVLLDMARHPQISRGGPQQFAKP